jgi:YVTN family beta-propeller protein
MEPVPEIGRRLALLVATSAYNDPDLRQLRAPGHDATELAEVLRDPRIGGFDVQVLINPASGEVQEGIEDFCTDRHPDDQLLIYLSCHGVLDSYGRLYYAAANTRRHRLAATAVAAAWLNERLEDCRARRQILVLDCCHSGAFAKGTKGDTDLALQHRFEPHGRGRVVLTASRSTEYSFEGGRASGEGVPSVFTHAIINGLRTGDADRDKDGLITVTDLYQYVYDGVRAAEPRQTPELWTYGAEGNLLVAHSIRGAVIEPEPLPEDLRMTLESPRRRVRETGVAELADLLDGAGPGLALAARQALERIAREDHPQVGALARIAASAAGGTAADQVRRELAERINREERARQEATQREAEEAARREAEEKARRDVIRDEAVPRPAPRGAHQALPLASPQPLSAASAGPQAVLSAPHEPQPELSPAVPSEPETGPAASPSEQAAGHGAHDSPIVTTAHPPDAGEETDSPAQPVPHGKLAPQPGRPLSFRPTRRMSLIVGVVVVIATAAGVTIAAVLGGNPHRKTGGALPAQTVPFAYVANFGGNSVTPVNLATDATGTPVKVGKNPYAIAITPNGKTAYVANFGGSSVTPINLATGRPGTPIKVGGAPEAIAITRNGKTAYVASFDDGTVTPIILATSHPGTPIKVGGIPSAIAFTPNGATAYVANYGEGTVIPIDVATGHPGRPIKVGQEPNAIVITRDGKAAYVTSLGDGTVTPIILATSHPGTPIKVGKKPNAIAITPDGKTAYVTNSGDGTIIPLNLATGATGTPISVGNGPGAIAIIRHR